jgi:hypothetical protein
MPTDEELDDMAVKITGQPWSAQPGPNERALIMRLTISARVDRGQDDLIESLNAIASNSDQLVNEQRKVVEHLSAISADTEKLGVIAEWFDKSKLWEGEAYVRS